MLLLSALRARRPISRRVLVGTGLLAAGAAGAASAEDDTRIGDVRGARTAAAACTGCVC